MSELSLQTLDPILDAVQVLIHLLDVIKWDPIGLSCNNSTFLLNLVGIQMPPFDSEDAVLRCSEQNSQERGLPDGYDASEDGKRLNFLTVIDEFTRESLAIRVARSIKADNVIEELAMLFEDRGAPEYVRSDNGPEFVADAVQVCTHSSFRPIDLDRMRGPL